MITIFSNPRPFKGVFNVIQRNAIQSWLLLNPPCEIILFNDEENTTVPIANEFGIKCITNGKVNEFGTPLLNDAFSIVQEIAKHEVLAFVTSDILLTNDLIDAIKAIKIKPFFMSGRRWDLDLNYSINFSHSNWVQEMKIKISEKGKLHPATGLDYWIFNKSTNYNMPEFAVGRPGSDTWFIYKNKIMNIPIIDATNRVLIVHQNHPVRSNYDPTFIIETNRHRNFIKSYFTLGDADWKLTNNGLKKVSLKPYNVYRYLLQTPELLPGKSIYWKPVKIIAVIISYFHIFLKSKFNK